MSWVVARCRALRCIYMKYLLTTAVFASLLALAGCKTQPSLETEQGAELQSPLSVLRSSLYCDSYLIYDMCVVDVDKSGNADAVYFEDTHEVFMYDGTLASEAYQDFDMHACVQVMDKGMLKVTNRLLTVTEETPFFTRVAMKKDLMVNYSRYFSRIRECREQIAANLPPEEAFGDQQDADFF